MLITHEKQLVQTGNMVHLETQLDRERYTDMEKRRNKQDNTTRPKHTIVTLMGWRVLKRGCGESVSWREAVKR